MSGPAGPGKRSGGGAGFESDGFVNAFERVAKQWSVATTGSPRVAGLSTWCDEFYAASRPDYVEPKARPKGRSAGRGSGGGKGSAGQKSVGKKGMFG